MPALGAAIAERLRAESDRLRDQWQQSRPVRHFVVDELLPADDVRGLYERMPDAARLARKKSLRESKWVGVDVDRYDPLVGAYLFGFQDPGVVDAIAGITGFDDLRADPSLYASGVSLMEEGDFLNPHIDNSHDGDQRLYRVLNLLFYVSPEWAEENGGNLELWTPAREVPDVGGGGGYPVLGAGGGGGGGPGRSGAA